MHSQSGRVKAPELSAATDWLNVSQPLSLSMLKGKIVVLDFWTFCCVDCMHILPYLKELEQKYADVLVVIGVHSAKFPNEKDSSQINKAIARYAIEHPVANDSRFALWEAYWVREWPTLVLIDPDGHIAEQIPCSKRPFGKLDAGIAALVEEYELTGRLNRQPLPFACGQASNRNSSEAAEQKRFLHYPGKIAADSQQIYISDTGHHRIIVADFAGRVQCIIGSGQPGSADGTFTSAQFYNPQGLAPLAGNLYVADTDNHLLRRVDIGKGTVETIAGTGKQALLSGNVLRGGQALTTDLSSPWDLVWHGGRLYICMAGPHQIWYYDPSDQSVGIYAGNAVESLKDGPLAEANLAQPSGITTDGKGLYFADAETSSIRFAAIEGANPCVTTLVGKGLFEFGDIDGEPLKARLQHPLGVAWLAGKLYVCDSYNHKIKIVDPASGYVTALAGDGTPGHDDGASAKFAEPGGLTVAKGMLYVADTNNHAIRIVDPANGGTRTLDLRPVPKALTGLPMPNLQQIEDATVYKVRAHHPVTIELNVTLAPGTHINQEAPLLVDAQCPLFTEATRTESGKDAAPAHFVLVSDNIGKGSAQLQALVQIYYCEDQAEDSACHVASLLWSCTIEASEDSLPEDSWHKSILLAATVIPKAKV